MNPDRVHILTSSLAGGGAEHHILNLCRYLKSVSVSPAVCVIPKESNILESEIEEEGIPVYRYNISSLKELLLPWNQIRLKRIIDDFNPDIIHAHLFHGEIIAALESLLSKIPVVVTRHSCGVEYSSRLRPLVKLAARRFSGIITVSDEIAMDTVGMGYPENRVFRIPNAIDVERFRPWQGQDREKQRKGWLEKIFNGEVSESALVVGSLGGLKQVKNYQLFLRVAAGLMDSEIGRSAHLKFVIIGEGKERERLYSLAEDLGLSNVLAMPGFTDHPERVLPFFDIFLITSLSEGVPLALLEAMAVALPCVASDVGGMGEVLEGAGVLVESGNESEFAKVLKSLMVNSRERDRLGKMARERVIDNYSTQQWGEKIMDVYRVVLEERNAN
jgi:glycosyltransferase involved in cell wall biosynthesis